MANKPLKSIKFPGLSDTYTVPQFDSASGGMGTAGTIPDSKAVDDAIEELKEELTAVEEDLAYSILSNREEHSGTLGSTGKWVQVVSSTYKHIVIPINPSDSVVITANNNFYTRIGFLRTYTKPTANGVPIDYSEAAGFTGRILVAKGTSWTGATPSDAYFLSIDTLDAGDNETPSYVEINGIDYTDTIFGIIENIHSEIAENKYILFDTIDFPMEWESGTFTTTVGSTSANANSVYRQRTSAYLKNRIESVLHTDGTFYTNLVLYNDQMLVTSVTGYSVTDKVIPKDTYYRVLIADAASMETDISGYTSAQIKAKITAQNTDFYDMINPNVNWCSMGDSIAEGFVSYLGDNEEPTYKVDIDKAWAYKVARTNHWNLTNIAVGGTGWIDWKNNTSTVADGSPAWYVASQTDFTPYNLVTLAYGINDWKANETTGTINDDPTVATPTTVIQAMKKTIEAIIASNPHCKIIVILPLNCVGYSFNYGDESTNWALGYGFSNSGTLEQFVQALISVCDYYGIQYIDMAHYSCVNRKNLLSCLTDGVHPNAETHDLLARELARKITFN